MIDAPRREHRIFVTQDSWKAARYAAHRQASIAIAEVPEHLDGAVNLEFDAALAAADIAAMAEAAGERAFSFAHITREQFDAAKAFFSRAGFGLTVMGDGLVAPPKGVAFAQARYLWLDNSEIRFAPSQAPAITVLAAKHDARGHLQRFVADSAGLATLYCANVRPEGLGTGLDRLGGLQLARSRIARLPLAADLPKLRRLWLHALPQLATLDDLDRLPRIERIRLSHCRRIADWRGLLRSGAGTVDIVGCRPPASVGRALVEQGRHLVNVT